MVNSRRKGHQFERDFANYIRKYFSDVTTSRYSNREADEAGIDLCYTGQFAFQCKNYKNYGINQMRKDLEKIPDGHRVKMLVVKTPRQRPVYVLDEESIEKIMNELQILDSDLLCENLG